MVVQHNMQAINSNRLLGITTRRMSKTTEKLSSGYKINRAADDAAGLAISEKMRKQIRGLEQATLNAQDGISAVQTAEGALSEVHDMIHRMTELSVKSANGTNSQEERDYIQLEIDKMTEEIDRISETTKFNSMNLLKGSDLYERTASKDLTDDCLYAYDPSDGSIGSAAVDDDDIFKTVVNDEKILFRADKKGTAPNFGGSAVIALTSATEDVTEVTGVDALKAAGRELTYDAVNKKWKDSSGKAWDVKPNKPQTPAAGDVLKYTLTGGKEAIRNQDYQLLYAQGNMSKIAVTAMVADDVKPGVYTYKGLDTSSKQIWKDQYGNSVKADSLTATGMQVGDKIYINDASTLGFNLHVGAESATENKINVQIKRMDSVSIGLRINKNTSMDVTSEQAATEAIDKLNTALKNVSEQRAVLGATQNRLDHTVNNLENVVENTTAAESQVRDSDMATLMVEYANNQILAQAGQAMLAQANQANQGVMNLLQ